MVNELGQVIDPKVLKELVTLGSVKAASIRMSDKGLVVMFQIGSSERILGQYRGGIRFFKSLDGAAALLQQNGITKWDADTTGWIPRTLKQKKNI